VSSQSYGPANYTVFGCYDFSPPQSVQSQPIAAFGTYQSTNLTSPSNFTITANSTGRNFPWVSDNVSPEQAGALISFNSKTVLARFGVSFHNADQACANAEAEVPDWDWDKIQGASAGAWEDVLSRVTVDTAVEDATVVELLYSSVSGCLSLAQTMC
jgi:putative alpha-1,2-mannosidase